MTDLHALRDFVLTRLGSPEPLVRGESYSTTTRSADKAYRRWYRYLDETGFEVDEHAVRSLVAELEGTRERDFQVFHCVRELLLDSLPVAVEREPDPDPSVVTPTHEVVGRSFGNLRWREKVLAKLGQPAGRLPGECHTWTSTDELWSMMLLRDRVELELSERMIDEAILAIAAMRERDRAAFEYGRGELLGMLGVELEVPKRAPTLTSARTAHA